MRPLRIAQNSIIRGGVTALCLIYHSPETHRDASSKVLRKDYQVYLKLRMTGVLNDSQNRQNRKCQNARGPAL